MLLSSPWYEQCGGKVEEGEEAMEESRKREARRGRKKKKGGGKAEEWGEGKEYFHHTYWYQ